MIFHFNHCFGLKLWRIVGLVGLVIGKFLCELGELFDELDELIIGRVGELLGELGDQVVG